MLFRFVFVYSLFFQQSSEEEEDDDDDDDEDDDKGYRKKKKERRIDVFFLKTYWLFTIVQQIFFLLLLFGIFIFLFFYCVPLFIFFYFLVNWKAVICLNHFNFERFLRQKEEFKWTIRVKIRRKKTWEIRVFYSLKIIIFLFFYLALFFLQFILPLIISTVRGSHWLWL